MDNKELWRKARKNLCLRLKSIINQHKECLISLRVSYEDGVKTIDLTPDQARQVISLIYKEPVQE